jgi:hypothetical protein
MQIGDEFITVIEIASTEASTRLEQATKQIYGEFASTDQLSVQNVYQAALNYLEEKELVKASPVGNEKRLTVRRGRQMNRPNDWSSRLVADSRGRERKVDSRFRVNSSRIKNDFGRTATASGGVSRAASGGGESQMTTATRS